MFGVIFRCFSSVLARVPRKNTLLVLVGPYAVRRPPYAVRRRLFIFDFLNFFDGFVILIIDLALLFNMSPFPVLVPPEMGVKVLDMSSLNWL